MYYTIKKSTLFFCISAIGLALTGCSQSAHPEHHLEAVEVSVNNSYAEVDLSQATPAIIAPNGTSSISNLSLADTSGASYRPDYSTWWLTSTEGSGLSLQFDVTRPTMVQLSMQNAFVLNSGGDMSLISIVVNGKALSAAPMQVTNSSWHDTVIEIPAAMLNSGSNTVKFALAPGSAAWFLKSIDMLPRNIYAENGELSTAIYAQFGVSQDLVGVNTDCGEPICDIWTRGYGLASTTEMIPGPTFFYKPGDLLSVNMINKMDTDALEQFEQGEANRIGGGAGGPQSDETLANLGDQIRQEVNIPHNLNNTNLHVHGLHVDPAKDDVTIVIVPEDEAGTVEEYDAPHHLPETPADLDQLNEGSVSDQPVKPGRWEYVYRIPENHLPGTHWFHPHKHGSTAAQLENGMAGSMVIEEPEQLAVFPNQAGTEWSYRYDEVMMIQQIANYGLQQGVGGGTQASRNSVQPITVINGTHIPNYNLAQGQIVRWRFVNAGANHRAFNHMWMGLDTGQKDSAGQPVYVSHPIYSVAFDGITVKEKSLATARTPFLLGPGNRVDVVMQVPKTAANGTGLALFKYYPTNISVVDPSYFNGGTSGKTLSDYLSWDCGNYATDSSGNVTTPCTNGSQVQPLTSGHASASNPYLFAPNSEILSGSNSYAQNFADYQVSWIGTGKKGKETNIAPLIKVADNSGSLGLNFALTEEFPTNGTCNSSKGCVGKWQPSLDGFGGGAINPEQLLSINVDTQLTAIGPSALPTDSYLSTISVTGSFSQGKTAPGFSSGIPSYVNPFTDDDILQSRPVIFDKSGAAIKVVGTETSPTSETGTSSGTAKVNQFTLNGRPFALNDMIGNSTDAVNERLAHAVTVSDLKSVDTGNSSSTSAPDSDQCTQTDTTACLDIKETLSFEESGGSNAWTNGVCTATSPETCTDDGGTVETSYYWANPGYFQALNYDATNQTYNYEAANITPDWQDISGLTAPAVVNPDNKYGSITGNVNGIPGLPVATTGEEWILVNNSDIGHPFHIHINPFFVLEVGQLSYETFANNEKQWVMRSSSIDTLPSINSAQHNDGGEIAPAPTAPTVYAAESDINHFVGNWWDTVIIPPHGYVKVRYWMNVPNQTGEGSTVSVEDDFNKIGIWVFHCHILRHEDRGMMMPIVTQQKEPAN